MAKVKGPERIEKLVSTLREWQGIERKSIDSCAEIMEKTDNPLIRQFMEIIRNDSVQHHRVQQFIIDSLTKEQVKLTPEERSTAVRATRIMALSVAGVDMIRSNHGPVVLEVNSSPGLEGIEKATGVDIAGTILGALEKDVRRSQGGG